MSTRSRRSSTLSHVARKVYGQSLTSSPSLDALAAPVPALTLTVTRQPNGCYLMQGVDPFGRTLTHFLLLPEQVPTLLAVVA